MRFPFFGSVEREEGEKDVSIEYYDEEADMDHILSWNGKKKRWQREVCHSGERVGYSGPALEDELAARKLLEYFELDYVQIRTKFSLKELERMPPSKLEGLKK